MLRRHLLVANPFNKLQYAPALWLDAADQGTLYKERTGASATTLASSDSDPVGTWLDKSGKSIHFTATADSKRPSYKINQQNGRSGIVFDGVDDTLSYLSEFGLSGVSGYTAFAVVQFQTTSNQLALSTHNGVTRVQRDSTKTYTNFSSTVFGSTTTVSVSAGIYASVFNGSGANNAERLKLYLSGSEQSLSFTGTVGTTTGTSSAIYLGSAEDSLAYSSAKIFEIIIFSTNLGTSQRQQVERYLGNKWGITLS